MPAAPGARCRRRARRHGPGPGPSPWCATSRRAAQLAGGHDRGHGAQRAALRGVQVRRQAGGEARLVAQRQMHQHDQAQPLGLRDDDSGTAQATSPSRRTTAAVRRARRGSGPVPRGPRRRAGASCRRRRARGPASRRRAGPGRPGGRRCCRRSALAGSSTPPGITKCTARAADVGDGVGVRVHRARS